MYYFFRVFDVPPPNFEMKNIFSSNSIEEENLLSVFCPNSYEPSSAGCQNSQETFRNDLGLDFIQQTEDISEHTNLEELLPSVKVASIEETSASTLSFLKVERQTKTFWCSLCGKSCVSNKRLKQHLESHSVERPHPCKVCGMRFKRTSEVTKHMRIHNDNKKFSCQFCQFKTVHKFALHMHIKRHFGEYQYKCDICDKGFYTKFDLTNHTILHSGDRPYQCHVCKLTFLYKNNLLYHKKTIHPDPDQASESFQCGSCGKVYQSKRSLLAHIQKRHADSSSHLCEVCGQSVASANALKLHKKKVHSATFTCKICEIVLDSEVSLKSHFSNSHEVKEK